MEMNKEHVDLDVVLLICYAAIVIFLLCSTGGAILAALGNL